VGPKTRVTARGGRPPSAFSPPPARPAHPSEKRF
jgi:hypothetical protein